MYIRRRLLLWLLLTAAAMACADLEQNEELLYASAFKLSELGGCVGLEDPQQSECLSRILTEPAISQPQRDAALSLIRCGNVRRIRVCNHRELHEIKGQGGAVADLWACHDVSVPSGSAYAAVQVAAFAMQQTHSRSLQISQVLLLSSSADASHVRASGTVE